MQIPEHAAQVLAPMCATPQRRDERLARDASDEGARRAEARCALDHALLSMRCGSSTPRTAAGLERIRGD